MFRRWRLQPSVLKLLGTISHGFSTCHNGCQEVDATATRQRGSLAAGKPNDGDLPYLIGEDGYPLGGPSAAEIKHASETRFHRDMEAALARWQRGDLTAFAEAVWLCWRHRQELPRWMIEASEMLVKRAMTEDEKRARREFKIHRTRWEALVELRERRPTQPSSKRPCRDRAQC